MVDNFDNFFFIFARVADQGFRPGYGYGPWGSRSRYVKHFKIPLNVIKIILRA